MDDKEYKVVVRFLYSDGTFSDELSSDTYVCFDKAQNEVLRMLARPHENHNTIDIRIVTVSESRSKNYLQFENIKKISRSTESDESTESMHPSEYDPEYQLEHQCRVINIYGKEIKVFRMDEKFRNGTSTYPDWVSYLFTSDLMRKGILRIDKNSGEIVFHIMDKTTTTVKNGDYLVKNSVGYTHHLLSDTFEHVEGRCWGDKLGVFRRIT